jgi:hypothetical protein
VAIRIRIRIIVYKWDFQNPNIQISKYPNPNAKKTEENLRSMTNFGSLRPRLSTQELFQFFSNGRGHSLIWNNGSLEKRRRKIVRKEEKGKKRKKRKKRKKKRTEQDMQVYPAGAVCSGRDFAYDSMQAL